MTAKTLRDAAQALLDQYDDRYARHDLRDHIEALRTALAVPAQGDDALDARRYRWLRSQPDNTEAPRIDVVLWEKNDESSNAGTGLREAALDVAIDAALASQEKEHDAP